MTYPNRLAVLLRVAELPSLPGSEHEALRTATKAAVRDWPTDLIVETLIDAMVLSWDYDFLTRKHR